MHKQKEAKHYYPRKGQVRFRLLCNCYAIGGLIGSHGSVVKALERETSSEISVDVPGPTANHRVVHIRGTHSLTRTIIIDGGETRVSTAQDALIRVFERMIEVEAEERDGGGGGGGIVKCRLLVGPGMVGAVLGKGGKRIGKVVQETKASVKVLPLESPPPPGADISDQMVQITGGILPVKKTLVVVSQFLQQKAIEIERGAPEATSSRLLDRRMKMDQCNTQVNYTANGGVVAEVVFKLLCPFSKAGFVIGSKGRKVKSMEEETKAAISFSAPDTDCHERVVTVSASENRESQYSYAQNAAVRVFNELVSSEGKNTEGNTVTVRLLILPYQSDWLSGGEVSVISSIHNAGGATLKIMELDNVPVGAAADEKVLQIDGDYPNVQIALFQVTWILRERVFDSSLPKDSLPLFPHQLLNLPSQGNTISALANKMDNRRLSKENNGSRPPMFPHSQFSAGSSLTTRTSTSGDSATANGGSNFGRGNKLAIVTNTKLEIAVRKDLFSAVYGENDNNLNRLRLISGATVEVHDPSSGNDGKVIISGTSDQTLVAQSLLQAFLMSA